MKSATHIIVAAGILSACSPTQVPEPQSQGDIVTEVAPTDLPGPVQSAVSEAMPDTPDISETAADEQVVREGVPPSELPDQTTPTPETVPAN